MKKFITTILVCLLGSTPLLANKAPKEVKTQKIQPFYQGQVVEVRDGGSYTYMRIKEQTGKTFWAVVSKTAVKVGDIVRFQKQLVAKNFESKALNRSFDELMFANNLQKKVD